MESKYTEIIAAQLGREFSTVRQTLRSLREAGMIPGRRHGDITAEHLPVIIIGLCSPTYAGAPDHVKSVKALRLTSNSCLPFTVGRLLTQIVKAIPASPAFYHLDLDDGVINLAEDRVELETLTLTGVRSVVRYGAGISAPSTGQVHRVQLNAIRALAVAIGTTS
jgi:hypothetical protein